MDFLTLCASRYGRGGNRRLVGTDMQANCSIYAGHVERRGEIGFQVHFSVALSCTEPQATLLFSIKVILQIIRLEPHIALLTVKELGKE